MDNSQNRRLSTSRDPDRRIRTLTSQFAGFGSNNNTQTSAFGTPRTGAFGAPAATSGSGGLFGNTATSGTSAFGGFGSTPAATTSAFGGGAAGGSIFGGGNNTGAGFGSTTTNTGAFGTPATNAFGGSSTSAFGAPQSTALGGATGDCQGTGNVPFQPFIEKEPNSSTNQQNSFQSISFQQPYQKFSPEELRLADYTQGRRYGNQSNQPGAFGASSGFGSFGQTSQPAATGFGGTPAASTSIFGGGGFGATTQPQQSTAFGSNTATTGLFGAPKPATGLFGAPAAAPTTNLFGSTGTGSAFGGSGTGTGFGQQNNNTGSSSLFGGQNNAAPKPAFNFAPAASTGGGFGAPAATTGAFGGSNPTSLFGNPPAQNSPFGQTAAATTNTGFGGQQNNTNSLFGAPKPATTGLFGQPAANTGNNLFGGGTSTQQPQNTGLFGAPKPATGLFGAPQQANAGGSNLFGGIGQNQTQSQQPQSTSLFGGLNNNNQQKQSLFGGQPQQQQAGSNLFGGSATQTGLFGGTNTNQQQQQQPQNSLFGTSSLFGGSQQNQQTPQGLTASINDRGAFGNVALFASLADSQNTNPGPLATPLRGSVQKKATALPIYKLNPASSPRFNTPAKRGFGFSYSTYGSPSSVSSTSSTPGRLSGSLLGGGSLGRGLSKSMSTSSLRRSFNTEDSILAPGAFSASPSARQYGSTGSIKKLTINRSLRSSLFSQPTETSQAQDATSTPPVGTSITRKKSVNFSGNLANESSGALSPLKQVHNNPTPTSEELGLLRPPRPSVNGTKPIGVENEAPEMEQVKNNELAIVPEEDVTALQSRQNPHGSTDDEELGPYWMRPSMAELEKMSPRDRKVTGFVVGRVGAGDVTFLPEVDLSNINLNDIAGKIVDFAVRSCTVYPIGLQKPLPGSGLNVPSRICLKNSRPRGKGSRDRKGLLQKHISRLQKVPGTKFIDYKDDSGTWIFEVEHFTTYGLDYDDDEDEDGDEFGQSTLSAPPDTPTPKSRTPRHNPDNSFESIEASQTESDPEDTFEFRINKKKAVVPGAFGGEPVFEDDEGMEDGYGEQDQHSFLDERSVGSQSEDGVEEEPMEHDAYEDDESVSIMDQDMAGSYPEAGNTAEQDHDSLYDDEGMDIVGETPGAAMKERMRALKASGTPLKRKFTASNDWASTLKTTISPQKQDRQLLKSLVEVSRSNEESAPIPRKRVVSEGQGFATSIDLMNSIFGQTRSPAKVANVSAQPNGFKVGTPF
jgi:nuclear pore complex protein Nup98-Nup96